MGLARQRHGPVNTESYGSPSSIFFFLSFLLWAPFLILGRGSTLGRTREEPRGPPRRRPRPPLHFHPVAPLNRPRRCSCPVAPESHPEFPVLEPRSQGGLAPPGLAWDRTLFARGVAWRGSRGCAPRPKRKAAGKSQFNAARDGLGTTGNQGRPGARSLNLTAAPFGGCSREGDLPGRAHHQVPQSAGPDTEPVRQRFVLSPGMFSAKTGVSYLSLGFTAK